MRSCETRVRQLYRAGPFGADPAIGTDTEALNVIIPINPRKQPEVKPPLPTSQPSLRMSSATYQIEKPVRSDFEEWSKLFHDYIAFYNSKIEEEQYARTFDRIIEGKNGLRALVVRQVHGDKKKLVGIAHFFPEQTSWSEKQILLLNGKSDSAARPRYETAIRRFY